jgi:hypothetical protein
MKQNDFLKYDGWEFSAHLAFNAMNEYRNVYSSLSKDKKVKLAHQFYDFIYRCNNLPIRFESKESLKFSKRTADHPFSARVAHRAIMNDNQWLLDDVEIFKPEFIKLLNRINVTENENQKVKIKPDGNGDVKIDKYITERYENVEAWYDKKTEVWIEEFPLEIPNWYGEYEYKKANIYSSKNPTNLTAHMN